MLWVGLIYHHTSNPYFLVSNVAIVMVKVGRSRLANMFFIHSQIGLLLIVKVIQFNGADWFTTYKEKIQEDGLN